MIIDNNDFLNIVSDITTFLSSNIGIILTILSFMVGISIIMALLDIYSQDKALDRRISNRRFK